MPGSTKPQEFACRFLLVSLLSVTALGEARSVTPDDYRRICIQLSDTFATQLLESVEIMKPLFANTGANTKERQIAIDAHQAAIKERLDEALEATYEKRRSDILFERVYAMLSFSVYSAAIQFPIVKPGEYPTKRAASDYLLYECLK